MAKQVSNILRITDFEDNLSQHAPALLPDEGLVTDENLDSISIPCLTLIHGIDIVQCSKEFPIVMYRHKDYALDIGINTFIKSIAVSVASGVQRFSSLSSQIVPSFSKYEPIFYYEDSHSICHSILDDEICSFLLKKPSITVTNDGVMIFFTSTEAFATINLQTFLNITDKLLDVGQKIVFISIHNNFLHVTVRNTVESKFFVFNFDFSQNQPLSINQVKP